MNGIRTALTASHISVTPGTPVLFDIEVTNISDVIDGVTAELTGLDPAWVQLVMPVVSLFPESTATLTLRLALPNDCLAGDYLVTVRVRSVIDETRWSDHEFWVAVQPLHAASMRMLPSVVIGKRQARFDASIRNEGNVPTDFSMAVIDPARAVNCSVIPASLIVPAGQTRSAVVQVTARRPWFSQEVVRELEISGQSTTLQLEGRATFTQRPRIPRGAITFAILAAIIAVWAAIFLVGIDAVREKQPVKKAVPETFATGGPAAVDLSPGGGVGAALAGSVTSADGAPLPRITVEAFRLGRGRVPVSVGSTATADDGAFAFAALVPGPFHLRFTATGFKELWYPAADNEAAATDIPLDLGAKVDGLKVQLVGLPGTVSFEIVTPESTSPTSTSVTLTPVVAEQEEGAPAPVALGPFPIVGGVFNQPEIPTPATYRFDITSTGFEPATFNEALGAGQIKVINTVTLSAARGQISGVVTDANGLPVGNVDVTISSGPFTIATKTPTAGNIGGFLVEGLETPQTYVVSFSLKGYEGQTVTVDLAPGTSRTVNGQVLGGTGTLRGLATDLVGSPIGGAKIVVTGGAFTAETASLTGGDAMNSGTWSVAGLPTPGVYTVTMSSLGFVDQTLLVVLGAGRSADGVNASLTRANATISGIVTSGLTASGAPDGAGDVTVALSNGAVPRITTTATAPAGAYLIADVPPGSYTLTYFRAGVQTRIVLITVAAGEAFVRNIDLPPLT